MHDSIILAADKTLDSTTCILRDRDGSFVTLEPAIAKNSSSSAYMVEFLSFAKLQENVENHYEKELAESQKEKKKAVKAEEEDDYMFGGVHAGYEAQTIDPTTLALLKSLDAVRDKFEAAFLQPDSLKRMEQRIRELQQLLPVAKGKSEDVAYCIWDINRLKNDFEKVTQVNQAYFAAGNTVADRVHVIDVGTEEDVKIRKWKRQPPAYTKYHFSENVIEKLKQPTFNVWSWDPFEMIQLLEHMFCELGLIKALNIDAQNLKRWLQCVRANYRNNPFHNFRHCFAVTQMMYGIILSCKLAEKFTPFELTVLLTAAICHDLDHPGNNNAYEIAAETPLALK